jgi:hypothetical protein
MAQRWRVSALALVLVAAGCGSSAAGSSATTSTNASVHNPTNRPSQSALMVCADEGQTELAAALGTKTARPVVGTWQRPVYSCTYAYPTGSMRLAVRELADAAAAVQYFHARAAELDATKSSTQLGQGSAVAPDGSFLVVKDAKVLEVDAGRLPAHLGSPSLDPADVALTAAVTVMGCWSGA